MGYCCLLAAAGGRQGDFKWLPHITQSKDFWEVNQLLQTRGLWLFYHCGVISSEQPLPMISGFFSWVLRRLLASLITWDILITEVTFDGKTHKEAVGDGGHLIRSLAPNMRDATFLEFCNENAEIFQSKYQRLAGSFNRVFSKEKQMFSKKKQVLH